MSEPQKVRVITRERYTHYVRIPAELLKRLGLHLSREVYLEVTDSNPLSWEIKVTPVPKGKNDARLPNSLSKKVKH